MGRRLGVWFPAVRVGTGADVFTERLCQGLNRIGVRAEVSWLPARAEYLPWTVAVPKAPEWANVAHVNTWLHRRFLPKELPLVATMHLCVHDPALTPYKSRAQVLYHQYWVRSLEEWVLRHSRSVVAVSHYTAARTQEAFGLRNVQTIHNGVEIPAENEAEPRRTPHEPFRLLYVGNWSSRKGVDLLAPIMESLGSGFELWFTADAHGAHRQAVLPVNCRCVGRLNQAQVWQAYQDADALLFPSRLEGLPLSVLEAMAAGLPVIASDSSSLPELVVDGVNGYVCAVDDVTGYVSAARRMAADADGYAKLGGTARQMAQEKFSEAGMVDAYVALYRELLTQRTA